MKVYKEETAEGILKTITFRPDSENLEEFKNSVKVWMQDNTTMNWEEFFNRLITFEFSSIRISME